ncbi:EAL domain-containing response regulator [Candidatus Symbiobacter mobilis]|uniref:Signal transduction protein n=1 Tax=Candidatus Symbiobacter mobilis CR TaxID=946483 RepID=U5N9I6_9BURK|nr:EAL domain-containing protein [Candidatus Symbiobacter mobilis]AGX87980.1 signal transduction protein [Candidatus Symbiobacter mobilis CR]
MKGLETTQGRPLVLLVDDQPTNLHILSSALKSDYELCFATSGETALKLAHALQPPQLILLDVMMPGMDGIEVLRHLRGDERTRDIPVVLVSADTSEQTQLDGLDLGADDYLTKPVLTSVLQARVRNLLLRKLGESQLRLAAHVFEHSGEAIILCDNDNRIMEVNPAFTRMTGYTQDEVRGQDPKLLSAGRTEAGLYQGMWAAIRQNGFWQGEMWDRHKNGSVYPKLLTISVVRNRLGGVDYYIGSFASLTEQKEAEDRIRHLAHHDPLTGLPNRLHLQGTLQRDLALSRRENRPLGLMFIDLDRFKTINDTLGHHVGDELLMEVSRRLRNCVRESDIVARLGGDEFVVLLSGAGATAAAQVAEKIITLVAQPYEMYGHTLRTSPSIGISLFPEDGADADTLMRNADLAMYQAKSRGRNNAQFFSQGVNQAARERLRLENDLHLALERGQLQLYYQPLVDTLSTEVVVVEALLRWHHPELGMVPPDQFIPLAEEIGLILPLGSWVLHQACQQLRHWRDAGHATVRVAVNLSLHQLRQESFAHHIVEILHGYRLHGRDIELELTESMAMQNPEETIRVLHLLRAQAIDLALDDFGTGYSSLNHLKLLPIQRLKLDRSFVRDIETDPHDTAICSATVALAHAMGLRVVAEGVETPAQHAFLQSLGCDVMQGYLFARPQPADVLDLGRRYAGEGSYALSTTIPL